jgi:hypothetical protein
VGGGWWAKILKVLQGRGHWPIICQPAGREGKILKMLILLGVGNENLDHGDLRAVSIQPSAFSDRPSAVDQAQHVGAEGRRDRGTKARRHSAAFGRKQRQPGNEATRHAEPMTHAHRQPENLPGLRKKATLVVRRRRGTYLRMDARRGGGKVGGEVWRGMAGFGGKCDRGGAESAKNAGGAIREQGSGNRGRQPPRRQGRREERDQGSGEVRSLK